MWRALEYWCGLVSTNRDQRTLNQTDIVLFRHRHCLFLSNCIVFFLYFRSKDDYLPLNSISLVIRVVGVLWMTSTGIVVGVLWMTSTGIVVGVLWMTSTSNVVDVLWMTSTGNVVGVIWMTSTSNVVGVLWWRQQTLSSVCYEWRQQAMSSLWYEWRQQAMSLLRDLLSDKDCSK